VHIHACRRKVCFDQWAGCSHVVRQRIFDMHDNMGIAHVNSDRGTRVDKPARVPSGKVWTSRSWAHVHLDVEGVGSRSLLANHQDVAVTGRRSDRGIKLGHAVAHGEGLPKAAQTVSAHFRGASVRVVEHKLRRSAISQHTEDEPISTEAGMAMTQMPGKVGCVDRDGVDPRDQEVVSQAVVFGEFHAVISCARRAM